MPPNLDGICESKPPTTITSRRHPSLRSRVRALLGSSTKKSESNHSSEELDVNEEPDDVSPMRVLSPRATAYDPPMPRRQGRAFSFRKRRSQSMEPVPTSGSTSGGSTGKGKEGGDGEMSGGGARVSNIDVPITKSASQTQPGKEVTVTSISVSGLHASPARKAALTSHPADVGESDSSDGKFVTPVEEESQRDGFLDRQ